MQAHTCGLTPSIFREGGTFKFCGTCICPKSTVNASHHIPKCPTSKTVKSPGKVRTTVFRSYLRKGTSFPFSSGTLIPCGDGFGPRPIQNLASVTEDQIKDCCVQVAGVNFRLYSFTQAGIRRTESNSIPLHYFKFISNNLIKLNIETYT